MRRALAVLAGVLVLLVVGGVAVASIPDAQGVIHGCRKTNGGALSVIDSATQTCPSGTVPLNWSQAGPQGPAGPAGVAGLQYVSVTVDAPATAGTVTRVAFCPAGKSAMSGGYETPTGLTVLGSRPNLLNNPPTDANGWVIDVVNSGSTTLPFTIHVVCATAGS